MSRLSKINNRDLFVSFVFVFIVSFFFSSYVVPDDIAMLSIVSGTYSGAPDAHVIYMNIWVGHLLSFFYENFNNIEWYTLFFLCLHTISFYFELKFLKSLNLSNKKSKEILYLILFLIQFKFIVNLEFTTIALNTGLASLLIFLNQNIKQKTRIILGSVLLLISFSIRSFTGIIVLSCLFLYYFKYFNIFISSIFRRKLKISNELWLLLILFVSFTVLLFIDNYYYTSNNSYFEFREFDKYRGLINDGIKFDIHFSENKKYQIVDYNLIQGFLFDMKIYDLDYLKGLYTHTFKPDLFKRINNSLMSIIFYKEPIILFLTIVFIIYKKTKDKKIILQCFFLFMIFGLTSLIFDLSLKERFIICLFMPYLFLIFFSSHKKILNEKIGYIVLLLFFIIILYFLHLSFFEYSTLFLFVLLSQSKFQNVKNIGYLILLIFTSVSLQSHNEIKELKLKEFDDFKSTIEKVDKNLNFDRILVYPTHSNLTKMDVFQISEFSYNKKIIFSGWMSNLPTNKKKFPSYISLVDDSVPILVNKNDEIIIDWLIGSLSFHYGFSATKKKIYENKNYICYTLLKV